VLGYGDVNRTVGRCGCERRERAAWHTLTEGYGTATGVAEPREPRLQHFLPRGGERARRWRGASVQRCEEHSESRAGGLGSADFLLLCEFPDLPLSCQ